MDIFSVAILVCGVFVLFVLLHTTMTPAPPTVLKAGDTVRCENQPEMWSLQSQFGSLVKRRFPAETYDGRFVASIPCTMLRTIPEAVQANDTVQCENQPEMWTVLERADGTFEKTPWPSESYDGRFVKVIPCALLNAIPTKQVQ